MGDHHPACCRYEDFINADALPKAMAAKQGAVQRYCRGEAAAAAIMAEHEFVLASLAALHGRCTRQPGKLEQQQEQQQQQEGVQQGEQASLPAELRQLAAGIQLAWQEVAATPRPAAVLQQQQLSLRSASPAGPLTDGIVQLGGAGHTYEQQDMQDSRWGPRRTCAGAALSQSGPRHPPHPRWMWLRDG
jgi:hypothetical protein